MVKIKICGITNISDAKFCVSSGVDFLGFIFYKKSPRYISPEKAQKITHVLKDSVLKVGVFVDEDEEKVKKIAKECGLDFLQFHGDETPAYLDKFKGYKVIKALRIKNKGSFYKISNYNTDYFLLDTFKKGVRGGTGEKFDWSFLKYVRKTKQRFFVSGGLTPENIIGLLKNFKPFGLDVSSGVELRPGKKDHKLVKKFIECVRKG